MTTLTIEQKVFDLLNQTYDSSERLSNGFVFITHPSLTVAEIKKKTGLPVSDVRQAIKSLVSDGRVTPNGVKFKMNNTKNNEVIYASVESKRIAEEHNNKWEN